ncbi:MAG: hypothetical protein PHD76_11605 [Methylacidiphilales bacterium]|nr:hypothetical protein [Candidatus Methylacidiphilales bacterium]
MKLYIRFLPFLGVVFAVLATMPGRAEELPMPDTVVLKQDAALPDGISNREVPCAITRETDKGYIIDVSKWKGIARQIQIDKSLVQTVKRGDSTERDYIQLKSLLAPQRSAVRLAEHEARYAVPLREFIQKHPGTPKTVEVQTRLKQVEEDLDLLRKGYVRVDSLKFRPADLSTTDGADWRLWQVLTDEGPTQETAVFETECAQILANPANLLYPLLLDSAAIVSGQRIFILENKIATAPDGNAQQRQNLAAILAHEREVAATLPHTDLTSERSAIPTYLEAAHLLNHNPPDIGLARDKLKVVFDKWPALHSAQLLLSEFIQKNSDLASDMAKAGRFQESLKVLESILPLAELPGNNGKEKVLAKIEALNTRNQQEKLILRLEKALESFDLAQSDAALADCTQFLASHSLTDDRLAVLNKKLQALRIEKVEQTTKASIAAMRADIESGRYGQAWEQMERVKPLLSKEASLDISNLCLRAAKQALKKFDFYNSFQACMQARAIDTTNSNAQYAFLLAWLALAALAGIGFLVLLIVYAFFSNVAHAQRFRIRLQVLREDSNLRRKERMLLKKSQKPSKE